MGESVFAEFGQDHRPDETPPNRTHFARPAEVRRQGWPVEPEVPTPTRPAPPVKGNSGPKTLAGALQKVEKELNTANLSLTFLREHLRRSEVASVVALARLLQDHAADLAGFLSSDPRGKLVPKFVDYLGTELAREQELLREECEQLAHNLAQIRTILEVQQKNDILKDTGASWCCSSPSHGLPHELRD